MEHGQHLAGTNMWGWLGLVLEFFGKDKLITEITDDDVPKLVAEFAASGGAAVWDFHVSAKVVSPTIRRAHPQPAKEPVRR